MNRQVTITDLPCPQPDLAEFARGKLDAERLEAVAAHLDDCATCQETLVALAETSDTFVGGLQIAIEDPLEREAALRQGLRRVIATVRAGGPTQTSSTHQPPHRIEQIGPYLIEEQLGSGGMGTVFRAQHIRLKRTVALKVLPANRWANAAAVSRFEREMEAIGQLDHPHIVRASDAGEEQGMHYLVMEFVDGLDLSRLTRRLVTLPVADACELARQAAIGLGHAHDSGLVHRDVKPSNLILAWDRTVALTRDAKPTLKILDLGLALLGDEHLREDHDLTTVGQLMGTLDYMSPEQGIDSHAVDHRTDIYGLGATLFKLLTGRAPYADPKLTTLMKKMTALATKAAPSVGAVRDDLPADAVQIVDRMLARDPDERFDSAREVADALAPHAQGADLAGLLRTGLETEEPDEQRHTSIGRTPLLAAQSHSQSAGGTAVETAPNNQGTSHRVLWLWGAAALLFVAAGIVFHMATDFGEVVVRSDDPNVSVAIKRGDTTVDRLQLEQGEGKARIRSGEYDVEIIGDTTELTVIPSSITVRRGQGVSVSIKTSGAAAQDILRIPTVSAANASGRIEVLPLSRNSPATVVALIERLFSGTGDIVDPNAPVIDAMMDPDQLIVRGSAAQIEQIKQLLGRLGERFDDQQVQPTPSTSIEAGQLTYGGQSAAQWFQIIETERQPETLKEAVEAMGALGRGVLAAPCASAVLKVMRVHGSRELSDSGQLINASRDALLKISHAAVASAIDQEVRAGDDLSCDFLVGFFRDWDQRFPGARRALLASFDLPNTIQSWVDAADANPRQVGPSAELIAAVCRLARYDCTDIDGAADVLLRALRDKKAHEPFVVAEYLVRYAPEQNGLVDALTKVIAHDDNAFVQCTPLLPRLGNLATPAVPTLVDRLTNEFDKMKSSANWNQNVIHQSLVTLAALGPVAKDALPALRKLRDNAGSVGGGRGGFGFSDQSLNHAITKIEGSPDASIAPANVPIPGGMF